MSDSFIKDQCQGKCDTASGKMWCGGCGLFWKDIATWRTDGDQEKIFSMFRRQEHRKLTATTG